MYICYTTPKNFASRAPNFKGVIDDPHEGIVTFSKFTPHSLSMNN